MSTPEPHPAHGTHSLDSSNPREDAHDPAADAVVVSLTAVAIAAAVTVVVVASDRPSPKPPGNGLSRPSESPADIADIAGIAWQKPMTGPAGLTVLIDNLLVDVDAGPCCLEMLGNDCCR